MVPAEGPHSTQGTHRVERPQDKRPRQKNPAAAANKHSHLFSQLIRITKHSPIGYTKKEKGRGSSFIGGALRDRWLRLSLC